MPEQTVVRSKYFQNDGERETNTPHTQVCLICLDSECKLYNMDEFNLQEMYEDVTGYFLLNKSDLPRALCVECTRRLTNCSQFIEKTQRARSLLLDLVKRKEPLTIHNIKTIDRVSNRLKSNMELIVTKPDHCDRYVLEYKTENGTDAEESDGWNENDELHQDTVELEIERDMDDNYYNNDDGMENEQIKELRITVRKDLFLDEYAIMLKAPLTRHVSFNDFKSENEKTEDDILTTDNKENKSPVPIKKSNKNATDNDDIDYKSLTRTELEGIVDKKIYICDYCLKVGRVKQDFIRHIKVHYENRTKCAYLVAGVFKCTICQTVFQYENDLVKHTANHMTGKVFLCEHCSYVSKMSSTFVRHMRIHTGEKPYSCNTCSYKCGIRGQLLRHMRIHSAEKPYSCKLCPFATKDRSTLVRHEKIHSGKKSVSCKLCKYKCNSNYSLKQHMLVHNDDKPFSCDLCNYKTNQSRRLTLHMGNHTGDKPFACNRCAYKCNTKQALTIHTRTHTGEKPWQCDICSYRCARKENFIKHIKRHKRNQTKNPS